MFKLRPHESLESGEKRANDIIHVAKNCAEMKKKENERLKLDLRARDESIRTKDDIIKGLKAENKNLKNLLDETENDLSSREKMAALKAKNVENRNIIRQLDDENENLKNSNAKKDRIIKSLEAENQRYKIQLSTSSKAADFKPPQNHDSKFNIKLSKIEPKIDESEKKKPLQRKRKALNDLSLQSSCATKASCSKAINLAKNALNDSGIDLKVPDDLPHDIKNYYIINQKLNFYQ
uniref:Uncharacterized protein n=1 Tax=Panagrolaimus sp. ES5 TaxID=591445 RepID=A0AC34FXY4_9BILA